MNHQQFNFRRATPDDASLISDLGARTFKAAFGPDNCREDMEQYLSSRFSKDHIKAQLADPSSTFLLVSKKGEIVGYAMLYESSQPRFITGAKPVELVRIYIETGTIGKGCGSALMNACLQAAQRDGYRTIWLGVWNKNLRAIKFYEKWGFKIVGTQKFLLGSDLQTDHVMTRPVEMVG